MRLEMLLTKDGAEKLIELKAERSMITRVVLKSAAFTAVAVLRVALDLAAITLGSVEVLLGEGTVAVGPCCCETVAPLLLVSESPTVLCGGACTTSPVGVGLAASLTADWRVLRMMRRGGLPVGRVLSGIEGYRGILGVGVGNVVIRGCKG